MRNPQKEIELTSIKNIHLFALDVTDSAQVKQTIANVLEQHEVDVVFNNAGYGLVGGFETYTEQDIQRQIETNILGVFRVAQPFITYFREHKKPGILLTTTSAAGIAANPLATVYSATKFALEGWSEALNYEVGQFAIRSKTIAPGGMATDYAGRSLNYVENENYTAIWNKMISGFEGGKFSLAEDIAAVVFEAAIDNKPQLRYVAGRDAKQLAKDRHELGLEQHFKEINQLYTVTV